jgi:formylglycine-generating enzyme required for sulfatase activity
MVWIPGGEFTMGSDHHYPEEAPARRVAVDGFLIDQHPVTNDDFTQFVRATRHVTVAETALAADDYPDADPAMLVAASAVFTPPEAPVPLTDAYRWWSSVPGADWRHPLGPRTTVDGLGDHPVVHLAWSDAAAYAAWVGKELPTEAEWEFAARGGAEGTEYAWGDELAAGGHHYANTWQGDFPLHNDLADGYRWTSPVGAFPPNGYGLVDMIGNVWEWTADWWADGHRLARNGPSCCAPAVPRNPTGGSRALSVDPAQPLAARQHRRVIKGGSYLCAPTYCRRYRPPARMPQTVDTSTCHLGFRCVSRTA